ncbi:unnamed protein product, partial [Owenia fusiformis]
LNKFSIKLQSTRKKVKTPKHHPKKQKIDIPTNETESEDSGDSDIIEIVDDCDENTSAGRTCCSLTHSTRIENDNTAGPSTGSCCQEYVTRMEVTNMVLKERVFQQEQNRKIIKLLKEWRKSTSQRHTNRRVRSPDGDCLSRANVAIVQDCSRELARRNQLCPYCRDVTSYLKVYLL